jgi:RNA polymerase sigma-70 factor (ECF subfamily)
MSTESRLGEGLAVPPRTTIMGEDKPMAESRVVTTSLSDASPLVERAMRADTAAFNELIAPRLRRMLRLAASVLMNEADAADVVQDVCVDAWRRLPTLRDPANFDAWLSRILLNACRDAIRVRGRARVREIHPDAVDPDAHAERIAPLADTVTGAMAVRSAFARLGADDRTILALHHVDDRPLSEISVLLGIPEGTAKWRLHRARHALERALESER